MNITCTIKQKTGEQWEYVDLGALAGKTLEDIFRGFDGKEVVAEFVIFGNKFFFCGTPHWVERMNRKGKAVSFLGALETLRERRPALLREEIPGLREVFEVFSEPGAVLESFTVGDRPGNHPA